MRGSAEHLVNEEGRVLGEELHASAVDEGNTQPWLCVVGRAEGSAGAVSLSDRTRDLLAELSARVGDQVGIPDPDIMAESPLAPRFRRKGTGRPADERKELIGRCFRSGAERGIPFFPPGQESLLGSRMVEFMQGEYRLPV